MTIIINSQATIMEIIRFVLTTISAPVSSTYSLGIKMVESKDFIDTK